MAISKQIGINLKDDVRELWNKSRGVHPHTDFAMGCLASFMLIDADKQNELLTLVAAVRQGMTTWQAVLDWCEKEKGAQLRGKAEGEILHKIGRRKRKPQARE